MSGASERRRATQPVERNDRETRSFGASKDRGRSADTPAEIPAKGWKDIVLRIYQDIGDDRIVAIAAGVTFFVLLALFPGIAGLIAVYGLFADPGTMAGISMPSPASCQRAVRRSSRNRSIG